MRRCFILCVCLLALVAGAFAQTSQKVIKDPTEYNAYITALNTTDPTQKAALMETFIAQYPNSVVHVDAMEQAMAAYQQAGNVAKVLESAHRLLQIDAKNVRALAIVTAIDRAKASQGDAAALKEMASSAQLGLDALPGWQKSEGMTDAEFTKLRDQMTEIFNGAAGFAALNAKDFPKARDFYLKVVAIDPASLQDTYQLAVAQLEMKPLDPNGFWYAAKAYSLAQGNAAAQNGIGAYAKAKYARFHGGDDGWSDLLASIGTQTAPPADFKVKPAPTPAELAVQAVQQNDPAKLSFSDWEYVLSFRDASPENKDAAEKVWAAVQNLQKNGTAKIKMPVQVISATKDTILGAITDDNRQAKKADVKIVLEKPVLRPPVAGSVINVVGLIADYTPDPFLFTMTGGELAK